jgi:membrane-associated protease RseP (regulator of RpoE activity)
VVITAIFVGFGLGDLLLFIVILVVIVMLHEAAHFVTAKLSGMKVTEFFVGFGPRLWSVRRGETEYGVKALPLGGYVRITGFTVLDDVAEEDESRTYRQAPFWKRIIVGSAGSAMHFLIALVLALIVAFSFGSPGNNESVMSLDHWDGVVTTPAQAAGLKAGDTIVSVDGKALGSVNALHDTIERSVDKPLTLGVERDGQLLHITVTPTNGDGIKVTQDGVTELLAPKSASKPEGFIGVGLEQANSSLGAGSAVVNALDTIRSDTAGEILGIGKLFSASGLGSFYHQVTNSNVAAQAAKNPSTDVRPVSLVGIASLGVQSEQQGLQSLFGLLILINIIFGLLNMLPMLPLDGGHVAVAVYEWIRTKKGRPFYRADITKLFPVVAVFLAFLSVFVIAALYLDVTHPLT